MLYGQSGLPLDFFLCFWLIYLWNYIINPREYTTLLLSLSTLAPFLVGFLLCRRNHNTKSKDNLCFKQQQLLNCTLSMVSFVIKQTFLQPLCPHQDLNSSEVWMFLRQCSAWQIPFLRHTMYLLQLSGSKHPNKQNSRKTSLGHLLWRKTTNTS